jgi:hypothetical protein
MAWTFRWGTRNKYMQKFGVGHSLDSDHLRDQQDDNIKASYRGINYEDGIWVGLAEYRDINYNEPSNSSYNREGVC